MGVPRECTFMNSWELLPQLLCAAKVYPFTIMHNHTGLASHQESVIIVFSNKMSNEFLFIHIHYFIIVFIYLLKHIYTG